MMQTIEGSGWKACYDEEKGRYFGEYGGIQAYHLYELTKEQYERLDADMTEGDAGGIMYEGRHLYMSVDDRCGPPYTIVFDDDYETLCPWARAQKSGRVWPEELTDAAVELFESERGNREQRRRKREAREKKKNQPDTRDLDTILESTSPDQLDQYLKTNRASLTDDKKAFSYYMKNVLDEKKIRLKDVYSFAGVSESYGSKILSMEKHTTQRDLILRLCIAGHFSRAEINRALKLYGMNQLYSKNPRDACIIVAVNNCRYDLAEIDRILEEHGCERLSKEE